MDTFIPLFNISFHYIDSRMESNDKPRRRQGRALVSVPMYVMSDATATYKMFSLYFYPPQQSCGKTMFLHLSVILFIGGGCLPLVLEGCLPHPSGCQADTLPRQTPPWQTPPRRTAPRQTPPLGRHPLGKHLRADTPPCPVHAGIRSTSGAVRILLECILVR